jgi:hypothetical protein
LSKELNVCESTLRNWIAGDVIPSCGRPDNKGRKLKASERTVLKLCKMTGKKPEEIFPGFVRKKITKEKESKWNMIERMSLSKLASKGRDRYSEEMLIESPSKISIEVCFLDQYLRRLPKNRRRLMELYFKADGGYTLKQVGEMCGISLERVRQLIIQSIHQIQLWIKEDRAEEFEEDPIKLVNWIKSFLYTNLSPNHGTTEYDFRRKFENYVKKNYPSRKRELMQLLNIVTVYPRPWG